MYYQVVTLDGWQVEDIPKDIKSLAAHLAQWDQGHGDLVDDFHRDPHANNYHVTLDSLGDYVLVASYGTDSYTLYKAV